MKDFYILNSKTIAVANAKMNNASVKKLWKSFTLGESEIEINSSEEFIFKIGCSTPPKIREGSEYALRVDENGAFIVAKDYPSLMRGFMSLVLKIEHQKEIFFIKCVEEQSEYRVKNRMIHICVFPENDLYYIKKLVRLAALCQYTHIVIEFWGTLKFDCLKELSWQNAFTKDEAKEIIRECYELGIEPIPMFNHLGHAYGSRLCYGKHVVLDQNPKLDYLFTPDGWVWNFESEETVALLKSIRKELYELFEDSSFFHIGCDEAYFVSKNERMRKKFPDFLNTVTTEIEKEGKRPMLWVDMLLEKDTYPNCYATGEKGEVEALRKATAKSSVFVDWQYGSIETPIPTLKALKDCGRDVMGAPWHEEKNYCAHIDTVADNNLFGVMLTTWHTLKTYMFTIPDFAKKCGAKGFVWNEYCGMWEEAATMLRRLSFEGNTLESAGWCKTQIEV